MKGLHEAESLSLADVAERTGIDRAATCRLENGTHENPTSSTLNRDAEALGRRISFRVVDTCGSATGWTESGIARANEQIDEEDQKLSGWHPSQLL